MCLLTCGNASCGNALALLKKPLREKISLLGLRQGDTLDPIYLATEVSWKLEISDV